MDGLEVHRGLAPPGRRLSPDHLGGELRQVERRRIQIQIGLVETIECEHDDGDALARVAAVPQWRDVVGAQQGIGGETLRRHLQWHERGFGLAVRRIAQDATQFGHLGAHGIGDRRLLGRGVEQLPAPTPVIVDVDAERGPDRAGRPLHDCPGIPRPPAHRQGVRPRPLHQLVRLSTCAQRSGQFDVGTLGGTEVRRIRQQCGKGTGDPGGPISLPTPRHQ